MSNDNSTIPVSWEVAKYLVPSASTGDAQAVLLLIKLACPDWADVALEDFTLEILGGGFSGNVPYKCSAKGKEGSLAFKVVPPEDDEDCDGGFAEEAYRLWSQEGIVPTVHLLGKPEAPGIEIYEFIEGKTASWIGTKHGAEFLHDDADAIAVGKMAGKLHSLPTDWYEQYKYDVKPQWSSWQTGSKTNELSKEWRDKYGDYAAITVLCVHNFSHRGRNMEGVGRGVLEVFPVLQEQLTTEVMSKIRVCHGDMHGGNLLHRKQDGHGDLVAVDLDFAGYNPAVLDLAVGLGGTMSGPYGYFFLQGEPQGTYPSLASRRLLASTYLEALGDSKYAGTNVDDVVYDIEIGGMIRIAFAAPIFSILGFNKAPHHLGWAFLHFIRSAVNIFESCKTDADLKEKVIAEGVAKVYTDSLLDLGMKPIHLTVDQYKEHWDLFGSMGPKFSGPFLPDDPEVEEEKSNDGPISPLEQSLLRFHEATGADIKGLFDKFDTNKSGTIDINELMGAAVMCGVGFKSMEDAEKSFGELDKDGDGQVSFEEFKDFLKKE